MKKITASEGLVVVGINLEMSKHDCFVEESKQTERVGIIDECPIKEGAELQTIAYYSIDEVRVEHVPVNTTRTLQI